MVIEHHLNLRLLGSGVIIGILIGLTALDYLEYEVYMIYCG